MSVDDGADEDDMEFITLKLLATKSSSSFM